MKIDWSKSREIIGEGNQLVAVRQNSHALRYCHQPSEAVQLAAVQLAAVQQDGDALQYFKRAWVKETIRKITVEEIKQSSQREN